MLPKRTTEAAVSPGELVVEFTVPSRPVPWKASTILRRGGAFKDARLVAWQDEVRLRGRVAMGGRSPYAGPVRLVMEFHLTKRGGSAPDTSNLTKSTEDSLQGVAIANDRQVSRVESSRFLRAARDHAHIRVYAAEEA